MSSPGRIGETHKVEIEVRNVSDRYSNPSPGKSGKVSMEENHKVGGFFFKCKSLMQLMKLGCFMMVDVMKKCSCQN